MPVDAELVAYKDVAVEPVDAELIPLTGHDTLDGGSGNDWLFGRDGEDFLFGQEGDDYLNGGRGRDVFFGGPGRDIIWAIDGYIDRIFADDDVLIFKDAYVVVIPIPY